ncbi:protein FAM207A [Betta splendens]|uniref:Protein FAM207A n=1 Tax=Betta splendens TaxID=158456 RepID=A0A6P7LRX5_BETSP|nr:protein FAM207A [Betta splendens]
MVGKIKHVRQKLHQAAVKPDGPSGLSASTASGSAALKTPVLLPQSFNHPPLDTKGDKQVQKGNTFPTGIFAGTKISPDVLVQTLKIEENPQTPEPSSKGAEDKRAKSKKEKMKERRDRWLNKISSIKQAQAQQAAKARRQATPVVGDLRPLADALPELCQLISPPTTAPTGRCRSRKSKAPVKRPEPRDFSHLKESKKRKLLETETNWFLNAVKTLSTKQNLLTDIGEQLKKRMKQEEEQDLS